jgi:hypothetical protein
VRVLDRSGLNGLSLHFDGQRLQGECLDEAGDGAVANQQSPLMWEKFTHVYVN